MKKITLTALAFLLGGFIANAQDKKIEFGINLFPNLSIPRLTANDLIDPIFETGFQGIETWKPAISGGAFIAYRLQGKSKIGTGIGYQNIGEQSQKFDLTYGIDPATGQPINDPNLPLQERYKLNIHFVEIPIYYKFSFTDRWFGIAGLSAMVYVRNTSKTIHYFQDNSSKKNTSTNNNKVFTRFNLAANLGIGMNIISAKKLTAFIQPYAQYILFGIDKDKPYNRNFISLGCSLGIRI